MRPICVGYRVWASARLQANVLPDYFVGGRKGCDVLSSVLSIVEAAEQGAFVGSLDFTKAFDVVRPEYAEEMLRHHGCPNTVATLLGSLWGAQQRYLTFDGVVHPVPVWAGSSLPQGDPWSVLAIALLLRIPAAKVSRQHDPVQLIFVDDRSFACHSAEACALVWDLWNTESRKLGLKEHAGKAQFYHNTPQGRTLLRRTDCAPFVASELTALGVTLGAPGRHLTAKESKRLSRAETVAVKAKGLPVDKQRKRFFWTITSACSEGPSLRGSTAP